MAVDIGNAVRRKMLLALNVSGELRLAGSY